MPGLQNREQNALSTDLHSTSAGGCLPRPGEMAWSLFQKSGLGPGLMTTQLGRATVEDRAEPSQQPLLNDMASWEVSGQPAL